MKVLKTIEGGTVIEGVCLRKKLKSIEGGYCNSRGVLHEYSTTPDF